MLTESQLAQLSITTKPKPAPDAAPGPTCDWDSIDEIGLALAGGAVTAGQTSLEGSYKKYRSGEFENFKPVKFAGYPGYLRRKNGEKDFCIAAVAVRAELLYSMSATVTEESPYYGKPCVIAKKAATMAATTMSGSS